MKLVRGVTLEAAAMRLYFFLNVPYADRGRCCGRIEPQLARCSSNEARLPAGTLSTCRRAPAWRAAKPRSAD
jgi:hypothetical protein